MIGGAGTFPYLENDPPITVGTGITVAGGGSYAGQYVQFGVSGASTLGGAAPPNRRICLYR